MKNLWSWNCSIKCFASLLVQQLTFQGIMGRHNVKKLYRESLRHVWVSSSFKYNPESSDYNLQGMICSDMKTDISNVISSMSVSTLRHWFQAFMRVSAFGCTFCCGNGHSLGYGHDFGPHSEQRSSWWFNVVLLPYSYLQNPPGRVFSELKTTRTSQEKTFLQ